MEGGEDNTYLINLKEESIMSDMLDTHLAPKLSLKAFFEKIPEFAKYID